jgi:hypothetical protein
MGGAGRGVWRGEHDHAYPLAPVEAAQPLAVDEARLLAGPRDDVLAQMARGLVGRSGSMDIRTTIVCMCSSCVVLCPSR